MIDFIVAVVLLLALAWVLGFGFGAAEHSGTKYRSLPLVDAINSAANDPWGTGDGGGLWFTLMLVWTLVPSAIHFLFLLASPLALFQAGKQKRIRLHARLIPFSWNQMGLDERDTLANQISRELVQRNALIWGPAAGLFCLLLGGLALTMIALVQEPLFSAVVAGFAQSGVDLAAFLFTGTPTP